MNLALLIILICLTQVANSQSSYENLWIDKASPTEIERWVKEKNDEVESIDPHLHKKIKQIISKAPWNYDIPDLSSLVTTREYVYSLNHYDSKTDSMVVSRTKVSSFLGRRNDWETLFNISTYNKNHNTHWKIKDLDFLSDDRLLFFISDGGTDKVILKEFSIKEKDILERGFRADLSRTDAAVIDENTIIVSSSIMGELRSNYANSVHLLKRGTDYYSRGIKDSILLHEAKKEGITKVDFLVSPNKKTTLIYESTSENKYFYYLYTNHGIKKLEIDSDLEVESITNENIFFSASQNINLKSGVMLSKGTVAYVSLQDIGRDQYNIKTVYIPEMMRSITSILIFKDKIFLNTVLNFAPQIIEISIENQTPKVVGNQKFPINTHVRLKKIGTEYILVDFQSPHKAPIRFIRSSKSNYLRFLNEQPASYYSGNIVVRTLWTKSKDGTRVPYTLIGKQSSLDAKNNPTILYGYGGFNLHSELSYLSELGPTWVARGGVYVVAHIRGGGELGPNWHHEGYQKKKHKSFEDFISVAEELIKTGVSNPKKLGILGYSNGGLLATTVALQRPDLFAAAVVGHALIDMLSFDKRMVGASWISEYGDPENPEDFDYLKQYSPYHNVKENMSYPPFLFLTSKTDDRVDPSHGRRMAFLMDQYKYENYLYETSSGGHAHSYTTDVELLFFAKKLGLEY